MKKFNKLYVGVAVALTACAVLFQNCAAAPPPDLSSLTQSSVGQVAAAACNFNGAVVLSGQSVNAYQYASVPAGSTCGAPQVRTCNNGVLSGTYAASSCSVMSPAGTASCSFNGVTIAHGGSTTAYQYAAVPAGSVCSSVAETRICTNGVLSGSFQYSSCSVASALNCSFDGMTVLNGASVQAWNSPSTLYCRNFITRTCSNGVLSGSATYQYSSCEMTSQPGTCKISTSIGTTAITACP